MINQADNGNLSSGALCNQDCGTSPVLVSGLCACSIKNGVFISQEPLAKKMKKDDEEIAGKCSSTLSMRGHESPLPRPFPIPKNFPQAITLALADKNLAGRNRAKFIAIIAQSIYRFKNYPTEDEYIDVVQQLVKKWPDLDGGKGIV